MYTVQLLRTRILALLHKNGIMHIDIRVNPDTRTAEAGLEDICKFSSERCSSV